MADSRLFVITHIDIVPPRVDEGTALLAEQARAMQAHPGVVNCQLLRQVLKKNHFEFLTVWESQQAYEDHLAEAATRAFRDRLHPLLGSPIDDRLQEAFPGD